MPLVVEQLTKYPRLRASRLFQMLKERGYGGGQVDWAHFGKVRIGRAGRPLWAFVMVLSSSRSLFSRFFLGAHMTWFLRG